MTLEFSPLGIAIAIGILVIVGLVYVLFIRKELR